MFGGAKAASKCLLIMHPADSDRLTRTFASVVLLDQFLLSQDFWESDTKKNEGLPGEARKV